MRKIVDRVPWGIVASVSGIFCFYLTVAVFGVNFIFTQVNGQTGQAATIFDTWWQTMIFVLDIVFAVVFIGALTLFILKKTGLKNGGAKNEKEMD